MRQVTSQMLSVTDAAAMLHVAPRTVRRWLQDGDLRGMKIGTSWVVLCPAEHAPAACSLEGRSCIRRHGSPPLSSGSVCDTSGHDSWT
jgi:excisionase family DNA binding protein